MRELRIARVIGRLNVGGPAVQAIQLTRRLDDRGYRTLLLRGVEGEREGTMDGLAAELGVHPVTIAAMRRDVGAHDLPAVLAVARALRAFRPDIVHTEAAKAGTVGRAAARLALPGPRRPRLVHTFHGHSLEGYFSLRRAQLFLGVERALARGTDQIVAVSDEVKDDLVRLGVTRADRVEVIELGLDLAAFDRTGPERERPAAERRAAWGVGDAPVVTLVARLVPIKRVDRFLRICTHLAADPELRFVVVGDGELADELRASEPARRLGPRLHWAGFETDMPAVCFASDVVVLTSDNEGTPVSLIEAGAAGVPVVSTDVGGVPTVVEHGLTGCLVDRDDDRGFAAAVRTALAERRRLGAAGRERVLGRFDLERLTDEVDALYRRVLSTRSQA